jgi:hypothetical protein
VWWEDQIDDTIYFGIPEVGLRDEQGVFMEKAAIEPDVRVENDFASVANGEDRQLAAAVKLLTQKE